LGNHLQDIDDVELFSLLKQGDEDAFDTIYRRYWKGLFNAAYKRLPDTDKCQDIIQNIFVDLWQRKESLLVEKPSSYLYGAVRFQVLKAISKQSTRAVFYEKFEQEIISSSNADERILTKEAQLVLQLFLAALPKKRKKIFMMYYFEGFSTDDISQKLDISQKTVRNQLSEASRILKLRITHLFVLVVLLLLSV